MREVVVLQGLLVARSEGFEPPALGIEIRCSIQLSYERPGPEIGPQPRRLRSLLGASRPGDIRMGSN